MGKRTQATDHEKAVHGVLAQADWPMLVIIDNVGVLIMTIEALHAEDLLSLWNFRHNNLSKTKELESVAESSGLTQCQGHELLPLEPHVPLSL